MARCARTVHTRTRDFVGHPCKRTARWLVNGAPLCNVHKKQATKHGEFGMEITRLEEEA